ncbi:hypothetical protein M9H77_09812 [Catharanthus roseus]|uniref:Uncharacterized protein n=1 Tax=Catharanthus roseus TaxID=4058 RepID=A0ACC0C1M9_CATRO|nr:hypothetical protein M9H77_09812 [Catharanthus roseus]
MVQPSGRRRDYDLGPVTDRTGRVEGRTVTTSSRGVRGRHSTSDLPATPILLAHGFYHGTGEPGSFTQPPAILFRSRPPLQPHLSHTPMLYKPYGSAYAPSHPHTQVCEGDMGFEGDRGLARSKKEDDGDGGDDDQDEGDYAGDEEQPVPVAPASGSDGCPRHGKGLTGSFMSVMSKIVGSRNKRPDVAREVSALTQKRKKVKAFGSRQAQQRDVLLTWSSSHHTVDMLRV